MGPHLTPKIAENILKLTALYQRKLSKLRTFVFFDDLTSKNAKRGEKCPRGDSNYEQKACETHQPDMVP